MWKRPLKVLRNLANFVGLLAGSLIVLVSTSDKPFAENQLFPSDIANADVPDGGGGGEGATAGCGTSGGSSSASGGCGCGCDGGSGCGSDGGSASGGGSDGGGGE